MKPFYQHPKIGRDVYCFVVGIIGTSFAQKGKDAGRIYGFGPFHFGLLAQNLYQLIGTSSASNGDAGSIRFHNP